MQKTKAIKSVLERYTHDARGSFNRRLKHQKKTNKKLGLASDFGMRGIRPMKNKDQE